MDYKNNSNPSYPPRPPGMQGNPVPLFRPMPPQSITFQDYSHMRRPPGPLRNHRDMSGIGPRFIPPPINIPVELLPPGYSFENHNRNSKNFHPQWNQRSGPMRNNMNTRHRSDRVNYLPYSNGGKHGQGYPQHGDFRPPRLHDLQKKNKARARKYFSKPSPLTVPDAPLNTSSYIMRTNKLGLNAPLNSPSTPGVLPTPDISPVSWPIHTHEDGQFVEEAKELQVDPYGTMNGRIRLKMTDFHDNESGESDGTVEKDGSVSDSDGDTASSGEAENTSDPSNSLRQLERRMDHDLQRFEMLNSSEENGNWGTQLNEGHLRAKIEQQEQQISYLEEENLKLQEKLYLAEQEAKELKQRYGESSEMGEVEGETSCGFEYSCAAETEAQLQGVSS